MDWFKVMANYEDDLAIQKVGERGEVLFFRGLAYCARSDSDGFIPETQLSRFGLRQIGVRVAALVDVGLWDRAVEAGLAGYQVRNWRNVQWEAYAVERKRRKDRNRAAVSRSVARLSRDESQDVAPLEEKRSTTPYPPAPQGGHDGTHQNCRSCGTTRRQQAKIAKTWKPPWCGRCDRGTRLVGYDGPAPVRCEACHPLLNPVADEPESA